VSGLVTRSINGFFDVRENGFTRMCRARGIFRKRGINVLVGDVVEYEPIGLNEGIIVRVLPRKTELARPPIANVDTAVLVLSIASPPFQPNLLDRMLVVTESSGLTPIVVLTKCDLVGDQQVTSATAPYRMAGYDVFPLAMLANPDVRELQQRLFGHVSVFVGPSGVGKSTLANALSPSLALKMGEVSEKLGRGKHTTRFTELFEIEASTFVADAPGFSNLDVPVASAELRNYFPELVEYSRECPYRGCLHAVELECGVKEAVSRQQISSGRYESYLVLLKEIQLREERQY